MRKFTDIIIEQLYKNKVARINFGNRIFPILRIIAGYIKAPPQLEPQPAVQP